MVKPGGSLRHTEEIYYGMRIDPTPDPALKAASWGAQLLIRLEDQSVPQSPRHVSRSNENAYMNKIDKSLE
ncbi:hypothetical protein NL676_034778 [Syzygium grande]|nr:hypothetical protein NL676_034778 [Syzygium grande]